MKHDWEYKQIGDVCEVLNGLWTGKKPPFVNVGVIRNTNFTKECTLDPSNIFYTDVEVKAYSKRKLEHGDIIIEKSGGSDKQPVGRPILFNLDGEFSFSNFTSVLRIKDNSIIPNFFHKALTGIYYQGKTRALQSKTTGIHNLDFNKYLRLYIPIPPLPIQEQICSLLDKMNRVIEAKMEQLKELDKLAQAIFYDMFGDPTVNDKGWEKQKLGDCFSYIKNGANIKQDKSQIGFPITRIETLSNGVFNRDRMGYAGITDKTKYEQYILQDKDLLMSHINSKAYIGRTVLYRKKEGEVFIHGMNLLRLVPLPLLDSEFFCYLAKTDYVKEKIASIRKDAVNQSSFAISDLKKIDIPIPPLPLQQSFAEKVEAIERQKELINQSIKDVQTLFDAKMDYYFGD